MNGWNVAFVMFAAYTFSMLLLLAIEVDRLRRRK